MKIAASNSAVLHPSQESYNLSTWSVRWKPEYPEKTAVFGKLDDPINHILWLIMNFAFGVVLLF